MYTSWKLFLAISAIWALGTQLGSISALETMPDGRTLQKRDAHHLLQARQAPGVPPKTKEEPKKVDPAAKQDPGKKPVTAAPQPNGAKAGKPINPSDEAAGQLVTFLIHTGEGLDAVTSMGSNVTVVKLASEAVIQLLPQITQGREKLLKTANKNTNDEGEKKLTAASDKMTKTLKEISANPQNSNLIKGSYVPLKQQYEDIINVCEAAINLVIPVKTTDLNAKESQLANESKKQGRPPKQ
ncbi:hypothetical protein VP01_2025g2 [Puccinia sorghi]|uniref:Uncharacterized protein n=1 Tax=Puccinia sorghi TaxID=27349 RepID=A0A0L6VB85_9BASI|nr:hypothetical protein VP01_2025g2 [Puccinia sorghi]